MISEDTTAKPVSAPLTGEEYLESLRDGRRVFIHGELVDDVTTHPAFRETARTIARMYDALHDPATRDVLTRETDTGSGGRTHKFFAAARSAQDLLEARDAIAEWSRMSYGYIGRTPDYKASFLATLGPNPEYYAPYEENAKRWYKEAQERVWFVNHILLNPPVDRNKPPHEVADVFLHVKRETDNGLIVSGAKAVATGGPFTHFNFVGPFATLPIEKQEYCVVFLLPANAKGSTIICRPSYERNAHLAGSPFDYPLSSRYDENDCLVVFEDVLVPWENVFVYGDIEKSKSWMFDSGFFNRLTMHGGTRLAVKLEFVAGLLLKATEATGTNSFPNVQVKLGEVLAWRNLFWAIATAQATDPVPGPNGTVLPNLGHGSAYRAFAPRAWSLIRQIVQDLTASGLIVIPSSAEDFKHPEIGPMFDKYYRGSNGYNALEKTKLMKLLWDATGSEFAGRHELYERNYQGNHENITRDVLLGAEKHGIADEYRRFAEQCLAEYDLDGWVGADGR